MDPGPGRRGREIRFGIRMHTITRDTSEEAWAEADRLLEGIDHAGEEGPGGPQGQRVRGPEADARPQRRLEGRPRDPPQRVGRCGPGPRWCRHRPGRQPQEVADRIEYHSVGIDEFILPPTPPRVPTGSARASSRSSPSAASGPTRPRRSTTTPRCPSRRPAGRRPRRERAVPRVAVVVGNPRPASRTLAAALRVARELAAEPDLVVDLGTLGPAVLDWQDPDVARLVEQVGSADLGGASRPTRRRHRAAEGLPRPLRRWHRAARRRGPADARAGPGLASRRAQPPAGAVGSVASPCPGTTSSRTSGRPRGVRRLARRGRPSHVLPAHQPDRSCRMPCPSAHHQPGSRSVHLREAFGVFPAPRRRRRGGRRIARRHGSQFVHLREPRALVVVLSVAATSADLVALRRPAPRADRPGRPPGRRLPPARRCGGRRVSRVSGVHHPRRRPRSTRASRCSTA